MANKVEQASLYSSFVHARISFSNEFADSVHSSNQILQHTVSSRSSQEHNMKYKEAPVSSDFKFNVENYGFVSTADEIFFGGVLLPMEKTDQRKVKTTMTTLRDELSTAGQDSDRTVSKGFRSSWWKLGLNKSKKNHSNNIKFDSSITHKSQNCLASILESDD